MNIGDNQVQSRNPKRPLNHVLETKSERYFERLLPPSWVSQKRETDYGIDLCVEISEGDQITPLEFIVQLKSSQKASVGHNEKIKNFKLSTYNYLARKLQVVMLVRYVAEVDEGYWILLSDVPKPKEDRNSFTINIPKTKKLRDFCWDKFAEHVKQVSEKKLTAVEKIQEFECPFCSAILITRIPAPLEDSEDHWSDREIFHCGFQRFAGTIEWPCPADPNFPKFEDYDLHFVQISERDIWRCIAVGKTPMSKCLHLMPGSGSSKNEALNEVREKFEFYAKKMRQ